MLTPRGRTSATLQAQRCGPLVTQDFEVTSDDNYQGKKGVPLSNSCYYWYWYFHTPISLFSFTFSQRNGKTQYKRLTLSMKSTYNENKNILSHEELTLLFCQTATINILLKEFLFLPFFCILRCKWHLVSKCSHIKHVRWWYYQTCASKSLMESFGTLTVVMSKLRVWSICAAKGFRHKSQETLMSCIRCPSGE